MLRLPLLSTLVLGLNLVTACTESDQALTPSPCGSSIALSVTSGLQPSFGWNSACPIAALRVALQGSGAIIWSTIAVHQDNAIAPAVRYGVFPTGAALTTNPLFPLVAGTTYRVAIFRIDASHGDSLEEVGHAIFTP
jgi:hypothetical protein